MDVKLVDAIGKKVREELEAESKGYGYQHLLMMYPRDAKTTTFPAGRVTFKFETGEVILASGTKDLFSAKLSTVHKKRAAVLLVETNRAVEIRTKENVLYTVDAGRYFLLPGINTSEIIIDFTAPTIAKVWAGSHVDVIPGQSDVLVRTKPGMSIVPYELTGALAAGALTVTFDAAAVMGRVPDFISIELDKNSILQYRHTYDNTLRTYASGITAGVPIEVENESWREIVITPSAYPANYYISASAR